MLSHPGNTALHRQVFILAGQPAWQKSLLKLILQGYEKETLWVAEEQPEGYPFVETKKTSHWLGKEKKVVVFDANESFNPDSFAAISGIVTGGGFFILLLPEKQNWNQVYFTRFGQRLIHSIENHKHLITIEQHEQATDFITNESVESSTIPVDFANNYRRHCDAPFLTLDQQLAVEAIQKKTSSEKNVPVVLVSDRGRGKSAALGIAIARMLKSGVSNIAVTAPSLSATEILFKHIAEVLPDSEVTRGCVKYRADKKSVSIAQFYSPDNLVQETIEAEILFVDEAAAIPVPILTSFLAKYVRCVFATTVHGYEGTGRGFSLRFYKELDNKNHNWLKLQMRTPIRWADHDPLEEWMFSLLCLDAEICSESELSGFSIDAVESRLIDKKRLDDGDFLNEVFSLLVLAHYRTRPKDLVRLLDDEAISLYVSIYNNHVIAVALVIREGSFSPSLSTEVYQGKRRPQGHLLAQALTYHCGIEQASTLDYARIMRIAVHPEVQQQGIGSRLVEFITESEKKLGRAALGTSFGMNVLLLGFWKKLNFDVARIGFTREQTSGEHAAIMLLPLNSAGKSIQWEARARFNQQIPFLFDDVLKDLSSELKNEFPLVFDDSLVLNEFEVKDFKSFNLYNRSYELCISSINKFVITHLSIIEKSDFPSEFRNIIFVKVFDKKGWKETAATLSLSGQNDAKSVFYRAIQHLSSLINA